MKGEENLIPFTKRTEDEQRKIQKKGGRASGAARRRRSQMRKDLERLLATIGADGNTYQCSICEAMISKALAGDVKAAEFIRDTIGEKPSDRIEASMQPVRIIDTTGDGD